MAKKVKGFEDFNIEGKKEKLQKIKRSFVPNSDQQQFTTNTRNEFDEKTRKITAVTKDEVEDKLDHIKKFSEEFDWDTVANQFKEEFEEALEAPTEASVEVVGEQAKPGVCELMAAT